MIAALVLAAATSIASAHHAVSTANAQAQAQFDRGLTLLYAYNGEAAARAFAQALTLDPHLGMAAWGEALANATDLNTALTPARFERAQAAAQEASALASYVSPEERRYIDAVNLRYAGAYDQRETDDERYRSAMAQLVADYPGDDDAAMVDAEALLEHLGAAGVWKEHGTVPAPDGARAIALVNAVLARNPWHLMANHLCIHAYDFAANRAPAIPCADRLASLQFDPGEEHLAHMPAHTYIETGAYEKAVRASEYAWSLFEQPGAQPKYGAHDAYTGWSAAMMLGDEHVAEVWATRTGSQYNGSDSWATWARYGRWERIATSNAQGQFYAPLTRGWTDLHYGVVKDARKMLTLYGDADTDFRWLLEGAIAEHDGEVDAAIRAYDRAIAYQRREDEAEQIPLFPADELLGGFYYRHHRYAEAAATFESTLARYPNDPRALYGMALARRALGDAARSADALKAFNGIWNAPLPPTLDPP